MNNDTTKRLQAGLLLATLIATSVILAGCDLRAQTSSGQPNALINSPGPDSQHPVGEPIAVEVVATDPAGYGLALVELKANDEVVDSYDVPDTAERVTTTLTFTPTETGTATLVAVAHRDNGMTGSSARLSIEIVEAN